MANSYVASASEPRIGSRTLAEWVEFSRCDDCLERMVPSELRALVNAAHNGVPKGWALVPIKPTDALLKSMAVRYDHGLGLPGYYDQPIFGAENVGHERRLQSTLTTMRQLHEEVVGTGFYRRTAQGSGQSLADATP